MGYFRHQQEPRVRVEGMKLTLSRSAEYMSNNQRANDYLINGLEIEAFEFRATAGSPCIIRLSRGHFPGLVPKAPSCRVGSGITFQTYDISQGLYSVLSILPLTALTPSSLEGTRRTPYPKHRPFPQLDWLVRQPESIQSTNSSHC